MSSKQTPQKTLISECKLSEEKLHEVLNRIIYPQAVCTLRKRLAQIDSHIASDDALAYHKANLKKREQKARDGKDYVSEVKYDKNIGVIEFNNPLTKTTDSVYVSLYKNTPEDDKPQNSHKIRCAFSADSPNIESLQKTISMAPLLIDEIAKTIGGYVRDEALTKNYSVVTPNGHLETYENEKNARERTHNPSLDQM